MQVWFCVETFLFLVVQQIGEDVFEEQGGTR